MPLIILHASLRHIILLHLVILHASDHPAYIWLSCMYLIVLHASHHPACIWSPCKYIIVVYASVGLHASDHPAFNSSDHILNAYATKFLMVQFEIQKWSSKKMHARFCGFVYMVATVIMRWLLSEALLSKSGATCDRWDGKRDREGRYAAQCQSMDRRGMPILCEDKLYLRKHNDSHQWFSSRFSLGYFQNGERRGFHIKDEYLPQRGWKRRENKQKQKGLIAIALKLYQLRHKD